MNRKSESKQVKVDKDGRFIITEADDEENGSDPKVKGQAYGKRKRDGSDNDEDEPTTQTKKQRASKVNKQPKRAVGGLVYKAKRAQGDVKLPGRPDPFAYFPLSRSKADRKYVRILMRRDVFVSRLPLLISSLSRKKRPSSGLDATSISTLKASKAIRSRKFVKRS